LGDSEFAKEFAQNQLHFSSQSPYKTTYWRMVADKDIVPHMPPGINVNPKEPDDRIFPCRFCEPKPNPWLNGDPEQDRLLETPLCLSQNGSSDTLCSTFEGQELSKATKPAKRPPSPPPPKHLHSLLDYQHVGQLVKIYNKPKVPTVGPSAFEPDLSEGVLRKKGDMDGLLLKLAKIAALSKALCRPNEGNASPKTAAPVTPSSSFSDTPTTVTGSTTTIPPTSRSKAESQEQVQAVAAEQIAEDMTKAQALYDVDELSRLRQPKLLERLLLSIPSLLSHAPAAYQRNLVRARFHFKSFPGAAFEKRVGQWLEEACARREVTVKVIRGSRDGELVTRLSTPGSQQRQRKQQQQQQQLGGEKEEEEEENDACGRSDFSEEVRVEVAFDAEAQVRTRREVKRTVSRKQYQTFHNDTKVAQTASLRPREE
ncbi:hypothetical protein BGZ70_001147, partial [Mortierella alpina]